MWRTPHLACFVPLHVCNKEPGLDERGSISSSGKFFSFRQRNRTGSGAHPVSYPLEWGRGVKLTTHLHLTPTWSYTSTLQYVIT
jgi:hypothetical protein